jgi:hypothetical protein
MASTIIILRIAAFDVWCLGRVAVFAFTYRLSDAWRGSLHDAGFVEFLAKRAGNTALFVLVLILPALAYL